MASFEQIRLTMTSGAVEAISEVMMYPRPEYELVLELRTKAQEQLGGFSTGLGFIGSPGWVAGGAVALGAIESLISSGKHKKGLQLLQHANDAYKSLRTHGTYFPVQRIEGLESPNPSNWTISAEGRISINLSPFGLMEVGEVMKRYEIKRGDVQRGVATLSRATNHVLIEEEFIWVKSSETLKAVRWSQVEAYELST